MVKVLQKGTGVKGCKKQIIQDNKNNILLENNDKVSSSKQTNHIKTPYLFVRGRVAQFGLEIEHYPMERMWSNILPNPPKGRVFRQFREEPMNFPVDYEDDKSLYEDMSKTKRMSKINKCAKLFCTNNCYR